MNILNCTFKHWQAFNNILYVTAILKKLSLYKGANKQVLLTVLPIGWTLSESECNVKWVQRSFKIPLQEMQSICNGYKGTSVKIMGVLAETDDSAIVRLNVCVHNDNVIFSDGKKKSTTFTNRV